MSSPALIPTFSTAVNTWQCDENDHLNVQFYTEFAHEASANLLAKLGFGPRAQRAAGVILHFHYHVGIELPVNFSCRHIGQLHS